MSARLLHVFSTFAPGGPQVRTCRLLPELPREWKHAIVALDGCTDARTLLDPALDVELLPSPPRASTPATALRLARLFRERRPNLLCTYNFGALDALLAARLAGLRAVVHHEDGFRPDEVGAQKLRRVWARRFALGVTRALIVPSFTLERIAREVWHQPAERVRRIPNGIRVSDFPRADRNPARRAELGIPADAPLVGFVGHLRPEKNPVRAVEALAACGRADAHLLILGDGPERPRVEEAARRLGLTSRVHLAGHRADPRPDYRAMDAFLISSDTEQMPVALLEAMASALPVVSTDVGDVRAVLPEQQAALVKSSQVASLAEALAILLSDGQRARALGEANRARVKTSFSFREMAAQFELVYSRALLTSEQPFRQQ